MALQGLLWGEAVHVGGLQDVVQEGIQVSAGKARHTFKHHTPHNHTQVNGVSADQFVSTVVGGGVAHVKLVLTTTLFSHSNSAHMARKSGWVQWAGVI